MSTEALSNQTQCILGPKSMDYIHPISDLGMNLYHTYTR
jgi:hypothetical protein